MKARTRILNRRQPPWPALFVLILVAGSFLAAGCGSGSGSSTAGTGGVDVGGRDRAAQEALKELPYRYEFQAVKLPAGATDAFAARVQGPHHTAFSIGVAFGEEAHAVPLRRAGTWNEVGNGGFVFNNDILIPARGKVVANKALKSRAQWRTANEMANAMEQKLCMAETGKPCVV